MIHTFIEEAREGQARRLSSMALLAKSDNVSWILRTHTVGGT